MSRGVGPSWDSDRRDGPGLSLARRLIAVGLAVLLIAPSIGAVDKGGKENPGKYAKECEGEGWSGYEDDHSSRIYRACVSYDADVPTGLRVSDADTQAPQQAECPEGFDGFILERENGEEGDTNETRNGTQQDGNNRTAEGNRTDDDTEVGACVRVDYRVPDPLRSYPSYDTDLESCEVPDSERNGTDPVIELWDGYVLFCVVPILDPGEPDKPFEVSTEPCEPGTTDPEIRIFNGGLEVCLSFYVFRTSPDIPHRTV